MVKTLNTMTAELMVDPGRAAASRAPSSSRATTPTAKAARDRSCSRAFGHDDVIDLGGIETARGTEMLLPVWLRLMGALGTARVQLQGRALSNSP